MRGSGESEVPHLQMCRYQAQRGEEVLCVCVCGGGGTVCVCVWRVSVTMIQFYTHAFFHKMDHLGSK